MPHSRKSPKLKFFIIGAFAMAVALPFIAPAWSPINCEHQDIDLNSGRARFTRLIYWIPIKVEYKHTPLSEALQITELSSSSGDWHRVNTFSPGVRHSPHYIYHSALSDAYTLGLAWRVHEYSAEARREVAQRVLELWRTTGRDSGADEYLRRLQEISHEGVELSDVRDLTTPTANKRMQATGVPPVPDP